MHQAHAAAHLEDGVQDKLAECPWQLLAIRACGGLAELTVGWIKVPGEDSTQLARGPEARLDRRPRRHQAFRSHTVTYKSLPTLWCRMPCSSLQHSPVTPQLLHHVLYFLGPLSRPQLALTLGGKFGHIHLCELLQGEGPTMETRPKADSPEDRVNLRKQEKAVNGHKQKPQLPSLWVPWASDIRFHQLPSGQSEEILVIMYRMPNFAFIPSNSKG